MYKLTVWPRIGTAARDNGLGGAFKVWTVAQCLANDGRVSEDKLRKVLGESGRHPRTIQRWIDQALELGVFWVWFEGDINYIATGKAAPIFGARELGREVVVSSLDFLFERDWYKVVYALNNSWGKENHPRSRAIREEQLGIGWRKQIRWEKDNPHLKVTPAYCVIEDDKELSKEELIEKAANQRRAARENGGNAGYKVLDGKVVRQRPNLYVTDTKLLVKARKHNRRASQQFMEYSPNPLMRDSSDEWFERLNYAKKDAAYKAVRKALDRLGISEAPIEKYWFKHYNDQLGASFYGVASGV